MSAPEGATPQGMNTGGEASPEAALHAELLLDKGKWTAEQQEEVWNQLNDATFFARVHRIAREPAALADLKRHAAVLVAMFDGKRSPNPELVDALNGMEDALEALAPTACCDVCVICGQDRPATVIVHVINGLAYHHDCAEDRSPDDACPNCAPEEGSDA